MPGWHAASKKWVRDGKLKIIGVIQEQHPERCQLFAQWQKFDWPIVHDPINLTGNSAVPIAIAIDEHGVVRSTRPNPRSFEADFLDQDYPAPAAQQKQQKSGIDTDWKSKLNNLKSDASPSDIKRVADSLILWAGDEQVSTAIKLYQKAQRLDSKDPTPIFRAGVAFKMRQESKNGEPGDFGRAVKSWQAALEAAPNQYIWRRRIQQYGPRLDKPYPFYDWVQTARKEIKERGETPIPLPVEPVGAELASASRKIIEADEQTRPKNAEKIINDNEKSVSIETVLVPHTSKAKKSFMVHVNFSLYPGSKWSNEAGPLIVWVEGQDIKQSQKKFSLTNKTKLESEEPRKIEFEIACSPDAKELQGFALYYVCLDSGECIYRRQNFTVPIQTP